MAKTLDPDRRAQLRVEAKKLRRKGLSYKKIGQRLGISKTTVREYLTGKVSIRSKAWKEANPDRCREYEAKRNPYKREWEEGECEQCGGPIADFRRSAPCHECRLDEHERAFKAKARRYIRLREEGLSNPEIESHLELPYNTVAGTLSFARKRGMDVPRSPFFKAPA